MKLWLFYTMLVIAYCCGSISSAILVCRWLKLPDPRTQGSGNPGATNVLRFGGKKAAAVVLLTDILKGLIPVLLARVCQISGPALAMIAALAMIGHMFPVFFRFRGGKGVATAFGGILGLSWKLALSVLIIWIIIVAITRYVSLASIVAAACIIVLGLWFAPHHYLPVFTVMALIIIFRHRSNIMLLLEGKEKKLGNMAPSDNT